ncbi:hypothetical protein J6590_063194 [Homalodisca vitripennis]|nr:hypothetical protein J6590_063194 [Homalodisca vitripennis]
MDDEEVSNLEFVLEIIHLGSQLQRLEAFFLPSTLQFLGECPNRCHFLSMLEALGCESPSNQIVSGGVRLRIVRVCIEGHGTMVLEGLKKDLPKTPPSLKSTVHLPADIRGGSVGFLPDWQTYPLKKTILSPPPVDGTGGTGLEPR